METFPVALADAGAVPRFVSFIKVFYLAWFEKSVGKFTPFLSASGLVLQNSVITKKFS